MAKIATHLINEQTASIKMPHQSDGNFLLVSLLILIGMFIAYFPAIHGSAVWDDDYMLTKNPVMTEPGGLWRIFFDVAAVKVYYPVTEAVLWLECRCFGLTDLTGYHVVNILIHSADTIFLWRLLRQLRVPGAFAAAALFGFHPVEVESVAWITEHKNTLSLLFYLSTIWAYLRFAGNIGQSRPDRWWRWYAIAIIAYLLALGSKTTVTTLPPALLLVIWWKNGSITQGDLRSVAPFFVLALCAGLLTQWVETHITGIWNPAWSLSPVQQILLAGRAIFFYLAKLICPVHLTFVYPRWTLDSAQAWQFIYPAGVVAIISGLWLARRQIGRGPLVAMLFFTGTLAPALGFFHVLYQRYTFVSDHFQYLASIGPLTLFAAAMATVFSRLKWQRQFPLLTGCLVIALCLTTARSARRFQSDQEIWMQALSRDADSPLALENYGADLIDDGRMDEAQYWISHALQLNPESSGNWAGMGRIAESRRQYSLALEHYRKAVQLKPDDPRYRFQLGNMLLLLGAPPAALDQYKFAEQTRPDWSELHDNMGVCYLQLKQFDSARSQFEEALRLAPDAPLAKRHFAEAVAGAK